MSSLVYGVKNPAVSLHWHSEGPVLSLLWLLLWGPTPGAFQPLWRLLGLRRGKG